MSDIDIPQVTKFCNERIRVLADQFSRSYRQANEIVAEFELKGLSQLIPDDATANIVDGSGTDGRTPINGHDVWEMVRLSQDLIAMGTGANTKLPTIVKVSVNG